MVDRIDLAALPLPVRHIVKQDWEKEEWESTPETLTNALVIARSCPRQLRHLEGLSETDFGRMMRAVDIPAILDLLVMAWDMGLVAAIQHSTAPVSLREKADDPALLKDPRLIVLASAEAARSIIRTDKRAAKALLEKIYKICLPGPKLLLHACGNAGALRVGDRVHII